MRKLRNTQGRKKALFGAEAGAILAAAGINVAGTMAGAAIGSKATREAAKEQAAATTAAAQRQAEAIREQAERAKEYQEQSQEFIKSENNENRELQRNIQMQLQMLTGQQNVNDRLEASKIRVKYGGAKRRLARNGMSSLLRGVNIPFTVTDGGGAIPLGTTPEGYDLYELYGNDHEHYHKTRGGKNKTGVGIKFADGNVIEGEGNQGGANGEKMIVTPTNAYFLSKHTIKGFNPSKSVDMGMNPIEAYTIQEQIKNAYGISDNGDNRPPVEKSMGGTSYNTLDYTNYISPDFSTDTIAPTTVGVAYIYGKPSNKRTLACGGSLRRKARDGYNYWAAGLNALGNLGGAWLTTSGNTSAAKTLSNAYGRAAQTLADAYGSMRTIDMNSIRRSDFAASHAMPSIQAPVSQAASQIAGVDRSMERRLSRIGRNSASSAAGNSRMNIAELDAQDMRNRIYATDQEQMQRIRQANADRVTEAAMRNAELDVQASKDYTGAYLNLLQYNNDIENERILGAAGALSEGAVNGANAISQAQASNGQAWGTALSNSLSGFSNTLTAMAKRRSDYENVLIGADTANKIDAMIMKDDRTNAEPMYYNFRRMASDNSLPKDVRNRYAEYAAMLRNAFNFKPIKR